MISINKGKKYLLAILERQLDSLFILEETDRFEINKNIDETLKRLEKCFSFIKNKYYSNPENEECYFNPLHAGQYSIFLYFLANTIFRNKGNNDTCDKIYGINKSLSSADLFYAVSLPDVFFFDHPQGSVIGRGTFSDYFTFSQGCTIGNNKNIYPTIGKGVVMFSNSKILGKSHIGDFVVISANSYIKDENIPDHSMVFGTSPNLTIKTNIDATEEIIAQRFKIK